MSSRGENLLTGFIHPSQQGLFLRIIVARKRRCSDGLGGEDVGGIVESPVLKRGHDAEHWRAVGVERGVYIMDDKDRSGQPAGNGRSRKRQFLLGNMKDRKHIAAFLHTHTKSLFAGFLIVAILVLLFGIFSQFQAPATNEIGRASCRERV